jgi:hypothetical protein
MPCQYAEPPPLSRRAVAFAEELDDVGMQRSGRWCTLRGKVLQIAPSRATTCSREAGAVEQHASAEKKKGPVARAFHERQPTRALGVHYSARCHVAVRQRNDILQPVISSFLPLSASFTLLTLKLSPVDGLKP